MKFRPDEILFSPTTRCNLRCLHCDVRRTKDRLSARQASRFLKSARRYGVKRVGFTGGEPFLEARFLCTVTKSAIASGMLFNRIMTNGVWFKNKEGLYRSLSDLHDAGYDGSICLSVDAFHKQGTERLSLFIKTAREIWDRDDSVTIARVKGIRDKATDGMLIRLARSLGAKAIGLEGRHPFIKGHGLVIKILSIELSPTGKAGHIKNAWGRRWFKDDYCEGPGNVLFVLPNGDVKPCCGYATDNKELTIGNIKRHSVKDILRNAERNRLARTIFSSGLGEIRKRLESKGVRFPGKTSNHCYFCDFLIKHIPKSILNKCLD